LATSTTLALLREIDRAPHGASPPRRNNAGRAGAVLRGQNANVVDVAKTLAARHVVCSKSDVGAGRSAYRGQNANPAAREWATFEHIDNVPPAGVTEPDAKKVGAPYSYFDPSKPKRLWPKLGSPGTLPVSIKHPPKIDPHRCR